MGFLTKLFHRNTTNNMNTTSQEETKMSNIQKALDLINTFATGDTEKAASLLAEGYIQHNLAYGTGRDAFVGSVAYLASAPVKTTVENICAYEDGDKDEIEYYPDTDTLYTAVVNGKVMGHARKSDITRALEGLEKFN